MRNDMFKDNVTWITGASSGIGEALACALAREGAIPVLSARREDELQRVRGRCLELGAPDAMALPLDVTDEAAMPAAVAAVRDRFGRIDTLVNNAGIGQRSLCVDTEMAVYRRLMEVNVLGQIALTRAVLPLMLEQAAGHVAIVSSVAGKVGAPYRTGYCAAKHAVMGFFDALRAEVAGRGIRVTTITPGFIRTDISLRALRGDGSEFGTMSGEIAGGMDVDRAAQVIVRGFRRGKPEIPVGTGFEMNALWLKRLFPRLVFRMAARMARRG